MAKVTKDQLLEAIDKMTVLELAELVDALKEKYGVSGAPVMVAAGAPAAGGDGAAEAPKEQTEFAVFMTASGQQKIPVIKVVRELTGLGLKEAKELVDKSPVAIKEGLSKADADAAVTKLAEVGATAEVK
ncbi:MAG: 50S ribosomal protein L7/L12 [Actinobacteria bacterium]|nr:50S ribosomal protein L7/L12 [Actinomycetota bacterium]